MVDRGQIHPRSTETRDTINTRVVPVVFVPGIMGSRLDIAGAVSDWDPDDTLEMAGWVASRRRRIARDVNFRTRATLMDDLGPVSVTGPNPRGDISRRPRLMQIAIDATRPRPNVRQRLDAAQAFWQRRGWGGVVWSFYGEFLMQLVEQLNPGTGMEVCPVHAFGYDWRQSNRDNGAILNRRIRAIREETPLARAVIVVTHSMGGLVTRSAIQQGGASNMVGVVHTVMPADGAAVAYRRFQTGARAELGETEFGLRRIIGPDRLSYIVTQSVIRGATELLPSDSYPAPFFRLAGGIDSTFFTDIFAEYDRQVPPGVVPTVGEETGGLLSLEITPADVDNLRARLREARAFTRAIANVGHSNTFILVGVEQMTDVDFDWTRGTRTTNGNDMAAMVIRRADGDGTVPRVSARFEAITPLGRDEFAVEHASCFQNAAFRAAAVERVRRLLARAGP